MERLGSPADMIMTARRKFALGAFAFAIACQGEALAQDGAKPKPLIPDKVIENEIARYCTNFVPLEAEARVAYQTRLLIELEAQVKQRISELDKQETDAREWVVKREAMLKSATEEVAAMYAKMPADAAAAVFAIARVAGWIAHAAEEYAEPPLRFRGRAVRPARTGLRSPSGG